jgi:hypothetical protein
MYAELEGLICSGPLHGKQLTYALLAERAPDARRLEPEEALHELTIRYFSAHGPATAHDLAWWSGLTVTSARHGIALAGSDLETVRIDDIAYHLSSDASQPEWCAPVVHLLPNYDELLIADKDHRPSFDPDVQKRIDSNSDVLFAHILTIDGLVSGGWSRTIGLKAIDVSVRLLRPLEDHERRALDAAEVRFSAFMEIPVRLTISGD